jgi:flagellar protein FlbD
MIVLTRMNAQPLEVDPELIERADAIPETVVTMVDGTKHVVQEELREVIERATQHRAAMVSAVRRFQTSGAQPLGELVALPTRTNPGN